MLPIRAAFLMFPAKQKTPPIGGAFQKTAPGIPKTVLQEPKLSKEAADLLPEEQTFFTFAGAGYG